MTIDWTKPLELEDGTPVRVDRDWGDGDYTLVRCDGKPFTKAQVGPTDKGETRAVWGPDGDGFMMDQPMRVRNAAEKPALPPDWAIDKALALCGEAKFLGREHIKRYAGEHTGPIAFARYIAEHEEPPAPPVDPVVEAARLICAEVVRNTQQERWVEGYLSGRFDGHQEMTIAVATINQLIAEKRDG